MTKIFQYLLSGVGSIVRIGKNGPKIKGSISGIDIRLPDDSDFGTVRVSNPIGLNDAVNLGFVKDQILLNFGSPVQNLNELRLIPSSQRRDKQVREVADENSFYQFDSNSVSQVPDRNDPLKVILPSDIQSISPGRWIKTAARAQFHSQLLGLSSGNDHPQYQLRSEENLPNGYPSLSSDMVNPGIQIPSQTTILSKLRSLATVSRTWFLPDRNGNLATDDTFVGASSSAEGSKGLVPSPNLGEEDKLLFGDGTWRNIYASLKNSGTVTSNYGASKFERVLADTTTASFLVTLPVNPPDGTVVGILDLTNMAGTHPIIIDGGGSLIEGVLDEWQLDISGTYWELCYSTSRGSWYFLGVN